jgi:Na+-driven multidrug efflux pump
MAVPWSIVASSVVGVTLAVVLLHRHGLLPHLTSRPRPALRAMQQEEVSQRSDGPILPHNREESSRAWRVLGTVGLPVGGTFLVLFAANGAQLRVLNQFGDAVVSGFGIANATQTVLIVPAIGLGSAISILVNRARNAAGAAGIAGTIRRGVLLAIGVYVCLGALIWTVAAPVARLASSDPAVIAPTVDYLRTVGPTVACVGVMLTMLTLLEQTGSGFVALTFNICYFGASIAVAGWLAYREGSAHALFATLAAANVVALIAIAPIVVRRVGRFVAAAREE